MPRYITRNELGPRCTRIVVTLVCVVTVLGAAAACYAFPTATERTPDTQYTNVAPLPGDGIALDSNGKPDGKGALQIGIPVAYTPGQDYVQLGAYLGSYIGDFGTKPGNGIGEMGNGTGVVGIGFGSKYRVYASAMAVSAIPFLDSKVISAQAQVLEETEKWPALSIGGHDLNRKERRELLRATSNQKVGWYAVATKKIAMGGNDFYTTLGYGSGKFLDRFFGGVSIPVSDNFSLTGEYDGFQCSTGVAYRPGGRYDRMTLLAAYNGKCGLVVGGSTYGKMDSVWAVPIFLLLWAAPHR